ncbi:MAG: polysaccharide deacetylase family protein [Thiohalocapsa sp.]
MDIWHRRNLQGYGRHAPDPSWPGGARLALQFVLNVEEGSERTVLNGDSGSENYLSEMPGSSQIQGLRNYSVESLFDFGARVGFWRILRLFEQRRLPLTAFAAGRALELNPDAGAALAELDHEIAGHGYRWIDYRYLGEDRERAHIQRTCRIIEETTGTRPVGWYTGRVSPNTRRLLVEAGDFLYDSDAYDDELPYWLTEDGHSHLVIPYTLVINDIRYLLASGCATAADFFELLRDAFDVLWNEGLDAPRMMSVGLHSRFSGHPGRVAAIARFLDYVADREGVWICRRKDIAEHWLKTFPPPC